MAKRRTARQPTRRATRRTSMRKSKARRATTRRAKPKARRASTKRAKPKARRTVRAKQTPTKRAPLKRASARASANRASVKRAGVGWTRAAAVRKASPAKGLPVPAQSPKPARHSRVQRPSAPALTRARRILEDVVPTPPSSLDLNRRGSAVRTGHAELVERLERHHETGPALTGGDVDADWEEAYASGEEAPGGDNPTPDQSVVEDIGRSLGVEYDDLEELTGGGKLEERDRKRWELDPASSEDYPKRNG